MGIMANIGNFFKNMFSKVGNFISKMWTLAKPFIQEALSKTAQEVWSKSQSLLIDAVAYVASQGLSTDEAKQEAFKTYMKEKSEVAIDELKDSELNLLREMALAIYKKTQE
jgi:phage-related protein